MNIFNCFLNLNISDSSPNCFRRFAHNNFNCVGGLTLIATQFTASGFSRINLNYRVFGPGVLKSDCGVFVLCFLPSGTQDFGNLVSKLKVYWSAGKW